MASRETTWIRRKQELLRNTIMNCSLALSMRKGQLALVDMREYRAMWRNSELILKTAQMCVSKVGRKSVLLPNEAEDGGDLD